MADTSDIAVGQVVPRGALILIIEQMPQSRIRVSSTVLTAASPVFAAMLGPRFQEGQHDRSTEVPQEIRLPDDDGKAMSALCQLLHNKTPRALCSRPFAKDILTLAITTDKYWCHEALQLPSRALLLQWLEDYPKSSSVVSLGGMAAAAYLLDDERGFKTFTGRLVQMANGAYSEIIRQDFGGILPVSVLFALEEQCVTARRRISIDLPRLGIPECHHLMCVNYDETFMRNLARAFKLDFWPPAFDDDDDKTFAEAVSTVRNLGRVSRAQKSCGHTANRGAVTAREFAIFANQVESECHGLCLKCVKEGAMDLGAACAH